MHAKTAPTTSLPSVFSDEHEIFRETCRRFYREELEPNYLRWEQEGNGTPREFWRKAGEVGLVGMAIPEEYGGPGGDFLYNVIQNEEMGRFVGGASVGAAIATDLMTYVLIEHGTDAQKRRWCPGIVAGEVIQAMGLTEPGSGSDVSSIQARARRQGDEFLISGNKCYMSSGSKADLLYVVARTDDDVAKGRGAMTMFLVDAKTPGIRMARMDTIGMRASSIGEWFFDDVRVPADCILGQEGGALRNVLKGTFTLDRTLIATRAFTTAELAFDLTLAYVKDRKVFGQAVFEFQNTQFKLAELKTEATVSEAFVDRILQLHLEGTLTTELASMGKMHTAELAGKVVDQCLQLFGGYGYMTEYPIARMYKDVRVRRILAGSTEVMKLIIGRSL